MDKIHARMISYIKANDENEFQKLTYDGEEILLLSYCRRNFQFTSDEGKRIVRLNYEDELRIKETLNDITIDIRFEKNKMGTIKYDQKGMSMNFKCSLLNFKNSKEEIFIHYVMLDDLFNKLSESKLIIQIGD